MIGVNTLVLAPPEEVLDSSGKTLWDKDGKPLQVKIPAQGIGLAIRINWALEVVKDYGR